VPTTLERTTPGPWNVTLPTNVSPAGVTFELRGAWVSGIGGLFPERRSWQTTSPAVLGVTLPFTIGDNVQGPSSNTWIETPFFIRAAGRGESGSGGTLIERSNTWVTGRVLIAFNRLPVAPTLGMPSADSTIDRTTTQRFSWTHNDPDGDQQVQAELRWRETGASLWTTYTREGSTQHWDLGPETLPLGDIEWQVRTRDAEGWGPWSGSRVVTASNRPDDLQITDPVAGSTVITPDLTIEWVAAEQDSATVIVSNITAEISSDLVETVGPDVREFVVPAAGLAPGDHYEIRVYVTVNGLDSDFALVTVLYDPTVPLEADVTVMGDNPPGMVSVHVSQPEPDGTPEVVTVDIERRFVPDPDRLVPVAGSSGPSLEVVEEPVPEPVLLVAGLPAASVWTDPTVPARRPVEYRVRARAASGATSVSGWHA
jgi:hypothetical protein